MNSRRPGLRRIAPNCLDLLENQFLAVMQRHDLVAAPGSRLCQSAKLTGKILMNKQETHEKAAVEIPDRSTPRNENLAEPLLAQNGSPVPEIRNGAC